MSGSLTWAGLLLSLGALSGCSGCNTAGPQSAAHFGSSSQVTGKAQGSASYTLKPEVASLEEGEALQALRGVGSNGMALVFDSANSKIAALKQGDVLLVKNRMARKILAIDRQGDETLILTRVAGLPEVIGEGKLSLHQPMRFATNMAEAEPAPWTTRAWNAFTPPVFAQSQAEEDDATIDQALAAGKRAAHKGMGATLKAFHTVADDWDTDFDAVPENGRLHLTLKLTRNLETVVSEIDGDGYLADFDTMMDTAVQGGSVSQMQGAFKNINGAMDLKWSIGQKHPGSNGGSIRIDFPNVVSVNLAPLLEGLPVNLGVSGAVIVNPVTTGGGEFASGAYHLTYDGYQNFKLQKSTMDSDGPMTMDLSPGDARAITLAPTAMVVALAAPRIQLDFGGPALDVFHVSGLKEASDTVNKWADKVAQKYLSPDAYKMWKDSVDLINQALGAVENTGALVYLRVITTSTSMNGGSATMFPCRRETWDFMVSVGASAQAIGIPVGSTSKRIAEKKIERMTPPGGGLCKVNES
jgi:hypothetical protein